MVYWTLDCQPLSTERGAHPRSSRAFVAHTCRPFTYVFAHMHTLVHMRMYSTFLRNAHTLVNTHTHTRLHAYTRSQVICFVASTEVKTPPPSRVRIPKAKRRGISNHLHLANDLSQVVDNRGLHLHVQNDLPPSTSLHLYVPILDHLHPRSLSHLTLAGPAVLSTLNA